MNKGLSNFQTQNSQVRSKCIVYLITIYAELLICDYVGTAIAAEVFQAYYMNGSAENLKKIILE